MVRNELRAEIRHATMSCMSCIFGLEMQLGQAGLHVGVGHGARDRGKLCVKK